MQGGGSFGRRNFRLIALRENAPENDDNVERCADAVVIQASRDFGSWSSGSC